MEERMTRISLEIAEKKFSLTIPEKDEVNYRKAQELAEKKYTKYKSHFSTLSKEELMAMTIIDLAKNYIDLSNKKENIEIFTELSDILITLGEYIEAQ